MVAAAALLAVALVAYNAATNLVPGWDRGYVVRHVVLGAFLVVGALALGLDLEAMALAPRELADGWRWGRTVAGGVFVAVAAGAALAPRVPALARAFDDRRADLPPGRLAYHAFVRIPIGTAAFEELAFRGVLLGSLLAVTGTVAAVAVSSVAFGLWHVGPTVSMLRENDRPVGPGPLVVAVVATTVGGVGFSLLRFAADSLVAPVVAHAAFNASGLLAAAVIRRTA